MRVVFLGTPAFAVPTLEALARRHEVAAVYTQPDRPKGRGNPLVESPVKAAASALGIPIRQPERIRRPENLDTLKSFNSDIMVVVGYGQIIPQSIIDLPPHGILNVHASLLPKYRGAAPIQWAIANGEVETGITIMQIDAGLDTGDMLLKAALPILPEETAPQLSTRLALLGADRLIEAVARIASGSIIREKQNDAVASLAPILKKEDGLIDWSRPARNIYNRLRGFELWPGAYTSFRGRQLTIVRAAICHGSTIPPAMLRPDKRRLLAGCGENTCLELLELQPSGKKPMPADAFLNGYQISEEEQLGDQS